MFEKTVRLMQEIKEWFCLLWACVVSWFTPTPDELRERGFAYALNHLCNGGTIEELETQSDNPFDRNSFDDGIIDGLRHWETVKGIPQ